MRSPPFISPARLVEDVLVGDETDELAAEDQLAGALDVYHHDLFAAAAPVCGGGDVAMAKSIATIPIWAFHGDQDTVVKPSRSRDMIAALKAAGGSPRYTEYSGIGHNSWAATYRNPQLYEWLFEQRKPVPAK